jgi:hypothetical protein
MLSLERSFAVKPHTHEANASQTKSTVVSTAPMPGGQFRTSVAVLTRLNQVQTSCPSGVRSNVDVGRCGFLVGNKGDEGQDLSDVAPKLRAAVKTPVYLHEGPMCDPLQIHAYLDLLFADFLPLFRPLRLRARVDRILDFFAAFFLPAFSDTLFLLR